MNLKILINYQNISF